MQTALDAPTAAAPIPIRGKSLPEIDRTFTNAITQSTETNALIHTLVQLGRDLGLKTVAEGVEDPVQIDNLRGQNVDEHTDFC